MTEGTWEGSSSAPDPVGESLEMDLEKKAYEMYRKIGKSQIETMSDEQIDTLRQNREIRNSAEMYHEGLGGGIGWESTRGYFPQI
ncbi:MAG: hypothetical protein WDZ69_00480 [Candidatus Pacearchaeota archaeon]